IAALASQTLVGKLGHAFWEAFLGSSTTSPSLHLAPTSAAMCKEWDAEKVRKVVDVEPAQNVVQPVPSASASSSSAQQPKAFEYLWLPSTTNVGVQCQTETNGAHELRGETASVLL
ncbi:hypothetical protein F5J12DRAFT_721453, partial [Pisolithus orientalis]|uniref:uncharacterized protein n=1 Tax=Pisolithus orientalis TaxID=936130 RepID=UPI002224C9E1